jgi:hypothetical protein
MNEIRARVLVDRDHRISGIGPAHVPAGDHIMKPTHMDSA